MRPFRIAIAGGGIVGLTTALCLHRHCGLTVTIFEQADRFVDDVGAGMGLYANGLRVLEDLGLFDEIHRISQPFGKRTWERHHDGSAVAVADETVLARTNGDGDCCNEDGHDPDVQLHLQPRGCRRWRLQKVLYDAVQKAGIPIHFAKRTVRMERVPSSASSSSTDSSIIRLIFADGTTHDADLLLAADGVKSVVRQCLTNNGTKQPHKLRYTGTTCFMGIARVAARPGICLPTSTSDTHGVFFPTGCSSGDSDNDSNCNTNEQCFQFHYQLPAAQADRSNWGTLSQAVTAHECDQLVRRLRQEGWDEATYLQPLQNSNIESALRIGLCVLDPPLERFVYHDHSVVLLGDAAHPPVPFLGQGAQQGLEDAGVLALLLRQYCCHSGDGDGSSGDDDGGDGFDPTHLPTAFKLYERMRIPRTRAMLTRALQMGRAQEVRASSAIYRQDAQEERILRDVFFHETLPVLVPGVSYEYRKEVAKAIAEEGLVMVPEAEQEEDDDDDNNNSIDKEEENGGGGGGGGGTRIHDVHACMLPSNHADKKEYHGAAKKCSRWMSMIPDK